MGTRDLLAVFEEHTLDVRTSFSLLIGVGGLLTGVFFLDLYLDWTSGEYPWWLVIAENAVPLTFSSSVLIGTWRLSHRKRRAVYLSESAKWCVMGFGVMLLISIYTYLLQTYRDVMRPMVFQVTTFGAVCGMLIGYYTARLKKTRNELRSITGNVSDGIFRATMDEGLVFVNQGFAEMFGYADPATILDMDPTRLYANPEQRARLREDALRQDEIENADNVEIECRRNDGSTFTGLVRCTVIRDPTGHAEFIDGAIVDITDRKERVEELKRAKEEAKEAERLKSAFLANMSHEIRTPLTSIIGLSETLEDELPEEDASRAQRFVRLIERSGRRLMATLDDVLNYSQLEAGEMKLSSAPTDLTKEAEEVVETLEARRKMTNVDLELDTEKSSVLADVDPGGVRIVLRNLGSNAVKYTPENGDVCVRVREEETAAIVEVEDTGVGMNPDDLDHLFEPFRQGSEGPRRRYDGSGLGLAVTQRVIEKMGGEIEVETEKGEGTCFRVRFPRS